MKRALLIGINYLNTNQELQGCIEDIINIRNLLIDAYDYEKENIIMLRDDMDSADLAPTYENIMKNLDSITTNSHECEEIWIQYSGHGVQIEQKEDLILPVDYYNNNFIFDTDIHNFIIKIKCTAILLFDCCHSGSIGKLPWINSMNENKDFIMIKNRNIDEEGMPNPNIYFLTGCRDNQSSSDVYNRELADSVGVFSNTFNECLRDSRHNIDIITLFKNISDCLAKNGYSQNPVFSSTSEKPGYKFSKCKLVCKNTDLKS
jgi:hypothetical protein